VRRQENAENVQQPNSRRRWALVIASSFQILLRVSLILFRPSLDEVQDHDIVKEGGVPRRLQSCEQSDLNDNMHAAPRDPNLGMDSLGKD